MLCTIRVLTFLAAVLSLSMIGYAETAAQSLAPSQYNSPEPHLLDMQTTEKACQLNGKLEDGKAMTINLGWLDAKPDTTYRASISILPVKLNRDANCYLMIREHAQKHKRPFPSYHKTSVSQRTIAVDQVGKPQERAQQFVTRDDTRALSLVLVVLELDGRLQLSATTLTDIEAKLKAEEKALMQEVNAAANARKQLTDRTYVYSRSQMKYGLERNYEHIWTDRPLFVNRAYRVPRKYVTPFPSYARILEEVAQYQIDGLAFFPETKDRMGMYELTDKAAEPGVGLLTEFIPTTKIEPKVEALGNALKSKTAARIDGKVLITSYVAGALTPEQWKTILDALRAEHGDSFLFLPALVDTVKLRQNWMRGKPVSREEVEACQAYLRQYLDVCDGIYFNYPAAFKNKDHTFDEAFYRELFIPVFKSVLSEAPYREKYFGLSAYHSHSNPDLSIGLLEDGTRTVRHSFEAAMQARPDVMVLPEWDEVNENTCFRPTTCNSTTTQRIIRYYMSRIKGVEPTPLPDDDLTKPNLIISVRKIITLGEKVIVELLNVPDSTVEQSYEVKLQLLDQTGSVVYEQSPVTFVSTELQEHRLELDSVQFADATALIPRLVITDHQGKSFTIDDGLPHTQIRATWNWDYKFVKQPIRELLDVQKASLQWSDKDAMIAGSLGVAGDVVASEPLALVEVVADGDVVYAVNDRDELLRANRDVEMIRIEYRSARSRDSLEGRITLDGAALQWISNRPHLHQEEEAHEVSGRSVIYRGPVSPHLRWTCLAIPRAELSSAQLDIAFDDVRFDVAVSELLEKGFVAGSGEGGLHVAAFPYRRMLDMPFHVDRGNVTFNEPVWPWFATEQFHLRLTSKTGKTYRTRPLVQPIESRSKTSLRVFSEMTHQTADVQVASYRVPTAKYEFEPAKGSVLLSDAGRAFHASLGGFPDTTSGRGGRHSSSMFRGDHQGYPANATHTNPKWVQDEGAPALAFDGVGNYISFPRETLPRHGAFTLQFDIKPTAAKDVSLFQVRTHRLASFSLSIRDGKLHADYIGEDLEIHSLTTELAVPINVWSAVKVNFDFQNMTLAVGSQSQSMPVTAPGRDFGPIVFGGYGKTDATFVPQKGNRGWFKGLLRSFSITHNSQ